MTTEGSERTIPRPSAQPTLGPREPRKRGVPLWVSTVVGPVLLLVVVLLAWEYIPQMQDIPSYILPTFTSTMNALTDTRALGQYWFHAQATVAAALAGLGLGIVVGLILGILLAEIQFLHRMFYPYIVALQSVPKVALAPLFVIWFGFGLSSKVFVVFLLTFFPVLVNTISGIRSAATEQIEMFTALKASRSQIRWKLLLPNALPQIFTGIELAVVVAMLGAIVGEFVGAQRGLGVMLLQAQFNLNVAGVFAVLIILAAIGVLFNRAVRFLRKRVLFWVPGEQQ